MATLDPQGYIAVDELDCIPVDELDGCDHRAGLRLVAAMFAQLDELEQRIKQLEERERSREQRAA
jgi:hypothetical protein